MRIPCNSATSHARQLFALELHKPKQLRAEFGVSIFAFLLLEPWIIKCSKQLENEHKHLSKIPPLGHLGGGSALEGCLAV